MPTFITPPGYSGTSELTASTGLEIMDQGLWQFSQAGYNDGISFGLSIVGPNRERKTDFYGVPPDGTQPPQSGGELHLRAQDWPIAVIGNTLTSYTDPDTSQTYGPSRCRITVTGAWSVNRGNNNNSMNSIGCLFSGHTRTDLGERDMVPTLLNYTSPTAVYVIQGADVEGGAQDTFSSHEFWCRCTEFVSTDNSNFSFQSNTLARPAWVYTYAKSWQTD